MIYIPHQILLGWSNEKCEWVGACSMHHGYDKCIQGFGGETWKSNQWEDLGIDGKILKWSDRNKVEWCMLDWYGLG